MQRRIQKVTQCGTLTTFFFVFLIVFSLSSSALTTFGVNKPQNNPIPPTQAPIGKQCSSNIDCQLVPSTSCVKDHDSTMRCLCGDSSAPNNGKCSVKMKGLRHQCTTTEECEDAMVCRENNSTRSTILGKVTRSNVVERLCFCDDDKGYMENVHDNHCNAVDKIDFNVLGIFYYAISIFCYYIFTEKFLIF